MNYWYHCISQYGKDASNVRHLNYWLYNLVNAFFRYIGLLYYSPTLKRLFPMLGSHLTSISQPWKNGFQYWTIITVTNLGNAVSNVGLSFNIYQSWLIKNSLPTLENYEMTFQCWKVYLFFQYWFSNWISNNLPMFFQVFPNVFLILESHNFFLCLWRIPSPLISSTFTVSMFVWCPRLLCCASNVRRSGKNSSCIWPWD